MMTEALNVITLILAVVGGLSIISVTVLVLVVLYDYPEEDEDDDEWGI